MIPEIIPLTVVTTTMKFPKKKVLKCIQGRKDVKTGLLRPATLPQVTMGVSEIGLLRPSIIPLVITEDLLVEADVGHKIPDTISLESGEQYLMLKGYLYIGLRTTNITPITKVTVVDS